MPLFRVGQMVLFGGGSLPGTTAGRLYKVQSAIELPDGECCYRIKSISEASDRLAREDMLEPCPPPFRVVDRASAAIRQDLGPRPRPGGALR